MGINKEYQQVLHAQGTSYYTQPFTRAKVHSHGE